MNDVQVGENEERNKKAEESASRRVGIVAAEQSRADDGDRGDSRIPESVGQCSTQDYILPKRRPDPLLPGAEGPKRQYMTSQPRTDLIMFLDHVGINGPRGADKEGNRNRQQRVDRLFRHGQGT